MTNIYLPGISSVYACYAKNMEILKRSSSGGLFYLLGENVIKKNGVVFGARFDEHWEVVHDKAEKIDELSQYMGSKYLQSRIGDTYILTEKYLKSGRIVLFSGTPCQIAGLKSFLNVGYDNLLTIDLLCHGVPSAVVWREYLKKIRRKNGIRGVNFRDKKNGWMDFSLKIEFETGRIYQRTKETDFFMRGFLKNSFLRPSCYECQIKKNNVADITLGDFWSVFIKCPEMYNPMGTSVVLVNSDKGMRALQSIEDQLEIKKVDFTEEQIQTLLKAPQMKPAYRDEVFERPSEDILEFCRKRTVPPYAKILKRKIKTELRRFIK